MWEIGTVVIKLLRAAYIPAVVQFHATCATLQALASVERLSRFITTHSIYLSLRVFRGLYVVYEQNTKTYVQSNLS